MPHKYWRNAVRHTLYLKFFLWIFYTFSFCFNPFHFLTGSRVSGEVSLTSWLPFEFTGFFIPFPFFSSFFPLASFFLFLFSLASFFLFLFSPACHIFLPSSYLFCIIICPLRCHPHHSFFFFCFFFFFVFLFLFLFFFLRRIISLLLSFLSFSLPLFFHGVLSSRFPPCTFFCLPSFFSPLSSLI